MDALGAKVKIMTLQIHQPPTSVLRQSARCIKLGFAPTTTIGINSTENWNLRVSVKKICISLSRSLTLNTSANHDTISRYTA